MQAQRYRRACRMQDELMTLLADRMPKVRENPSETMLNNLNAMLAYEQARATETEQ